jgi:hypothetical protein
VKTQVVFADSYKERLLKHRVNPECIGDALGKRAEKEDNWMFEVVSGLNCAQLGLSSAAPAIECALVVANPLGLAVVLISTCSGSSESSIYMANRCVPGVGDIWDDRVGLKRKRFAMQKLRDLHAEYWNGMQTLGAMAC